MGVPKATLGVIAGKFHINREGDFDGDAKLAFSLRSEKVWQAQGYLEVNEDE